MSGGGEVDVGGESAQSNNILNFSVSAPPLRLTPDVHKIESTRLDGQETCCLLHAYL